MKLKKIIFNSFCIVTFCLFLVACSNDNGNKAQKDTLNWDEEQKIQTLDPAQATDQSSLTLLNSTMEGLYRTGIDSRTEPGMAKKAVDSKNKKEFTFYLRKAEWSNGDPVTAQDFVYAWRRAASPQTNSPYAYMFEVLDNGEDVVKGIKPPEDLGVHAEGNKKLVIRLHSNTPYLNEMLGFPAFFPLNKKLVEKKPEQSGLRKSLLVYNGPFKITQWSKNNEKWQVSKNRKYWDKKFVKLSKINFQVNTSNNKAYELYQDSKLDWVPLNVTDIKKEKKKSIVHKTSTMSYLQYNQNKSVLQNKDIRRAISLAINRRNLVNKVLDDGSKVAKSGVPTGTFYYWDTEFNKQAKLKRAVRSNTKQAKKLWKKGLEKEKIDSLEFKLLTDNSDKNIQTAKYIVKQVRKKLPNARIKLIVTSTRNFDKKAKAGDFDIALTTHNAEFRDPITFLNLYTSNSLSNDGSWRNSEYDRLVNNAQTVHAGEPRKRWNDMIQAEMILMNEQGIAPLYEKGETILLNKQVSGVVYKPVGVGYDFKRARIK